MDDSFLFDNKAYLSPYILEALSEAFIVADLEQKVQYLNSAACQILGISRDTTLGTRLRDLPGGNMVMSPEDAEKYRQSYINALKIFVTPENFPVPKVQPYEQTWLRQVAGNRILEYRSAAIWGKDHHEVIGIVVVVRDITTEHTANEVLNSLFNDMMTPLSSIKGYAEILLLESDGLLSDEQRQMVKIIDEKAGYLLHLRKDAYDAMTQQRK